MTAAATIFFRQEPLTEGSRRVEFVVGRDPDTFERVGGFDGALAMFKPMLGQPVVEMTPGGREVGEVVEVVARGDQIMVAAIITDDQAWSKIESGTFKGARAAAYGAKAGPPFAGNLMLTDRPDYGDVILRGARVPRGAEPLMVIDEARAAMRELDRAVERACGRINEAESRLTRVERGRVH